MSLLGRLITIGDSEIVSTNVSDTADDWSATAPYVRDDEVSYDNRVYVSLVHVNTFTVDQASGVDATNDVIRKSGHGLKEGDRVAIASSTTLPGNTSATTLYYVKKPANPTYYFSAYFQLATSDGGSAVNMSSAGSGTLTVYRNPNWGVTPGTDDTKWLDSRPTNSRAMFDSTSLTKTTNSTSIQVTVTPGERFNCIAFKGLANVSTATIAAYTSGGSNNMLVRSEEFDNAVWNKGTGGSITANAVTAPNGQNTADSYTWPSSTGSFAFLSQTVTGNFANPHTFSIWLKRPSGAGSRTMKMVLSDLTTSTVAGDLITVTESWQRFTFTTTTGNNTGSIGVGLSTGGGTIAAGDIVHVWGAQLNTGSTASNYNHVAAASQVTYHYIESHDLTDTAFDDDEYESTYDEPWFYKAMAVSDIDPVASASVLIALTGSGTLECGTCAFALTKNIGSAEYGASVGIENWDRVDFDEFGGLSVTSRGFSDIADYRTFMAKDKATAVGGLLAEYRSTPSLFLMAPNEDAPGGWDPFAIHIAINSFRVIYEHAGHSRVSLELKGLT